MIGVFDSGVGGLSVLREIKKALPEYDLIYFGDTARAPYGNKSKDIIIKYALEDADFLIKRGAKILVIACNTASSLAYDALKEKYPDIRIFEVIEPAVKKAKGKKRVGVIGTRATINSKIYQNKLKEQGIEPFAFSCPLFVSFIEEGWTERPELKTIARKYLSPFKSCAIEALILGCTHYPFIKEIIKRRVGRGVELIDSAQAVANEIKSFLEKEKLDLPKTGKLEIHFSDQTPQCRNFVNVILN